MRLDPSTRLCSLLGASLLPLVLAAPPASAQIMTDPNLSVTALLPPGSLNTPTSMAFLGPDDILVLEKQVGRVRRVVGGVLQPTPVLDVPVANSSEEGMLGIAIQQGSPVRVFLYYTESTVDGGSPLGNRIYRYDWNGTALVNPQLLLDLPATPGPNHNGGVLTLDTSGRLYAVLGDLNRNGQLQNNSAGAAPDNTSVIVRINSDGTPAAGNPFTPYCSNNTTQTCTTNGDCPGGTCLTQVALYYAYGVRNCFGIGFDPMTGKLWDTENGPSNYDEVNQVNAGDNSGWNRIMGPVVRDPQGTSDLWNMPGAGLTYDDPEFSWLATIAPTGILFPMGSSWGPTYDGMALVVDNNNGNMYGFPLDGTRTGFVLTGGLADLVADSTAEQNQVRIGQGFSAAVALVQGPDHHVYVTSIGNGTIYRISGPVPVELQGFSVE
jgi:glucose/arabinose dehydrogenase